jgi:hypothetical protein
MNFCSCKQCKKQKRKGKILGYRVMGFWLPLGFSDKMEYYLGPVSDYVPYHKFQKGRTRKEKWATIQD